MTRRPVMIKILTARRELNSSLFDDVLPPEENDPEENPTNDDLPAPEELLTEGRLITSPKRVELLYKESELSGMEGSITTVGFDRESPETVTMMRSGVVRTALVFEKNRRHICLYHTPFSDFEICVHATNVENNLLTTGEINLSYRIEIHGAQAERCVMKIKLV